MDIDWPNALLAALVGWLLGFAFDRLILWSRRVKVAFLGFDRVRANFGTLYKMRFRLKGSEDPGLCSCELSIDSEAIFAKWDETPNPLRNDRLDTFVPEMVPATYHQVLHTGREYALPILVSDSGQLFVFNGWWFGRDAGYYTLPPLAAEAAISIVVRGRAFAWKKSFAVKEVVSWRGTSKRLSRLLKTLDDRDGFWFPLLRGFLDRLYRCTSVGHLFNQKLKRADGTGRAWVSELYQFLWLLIGVAWLILIDVPLLTHGVWIGIGTVAALYRPYEVLTFCLHWTLVATGRVKAIRRSVVGFIINVFEVAMFLTIAVVLGGCLPRNQGRAAFLLGNIRSLFLFEAGDLIDQSFFCVALARFQLVVGWVLIVVVLASAVGGIVREEESSRS